MLWKYRTILFEFTKDGLLGDRYVDDEEMERSLNELGALGWELVNVVHAFPTMSSPTLIFKKEA